MIIEEYRRLLENINNYWKILMSIEEYRRLLKNIDDY